MGTAMGSTARRRRRKQRAVGSTTALVVGILGIGAAIGGLVYAADRFVDNLELPDLDFSLPGAEAQTTFGPAAMGDRSPIWSTRLENPLSSAPVVADNRLFVRDGHGYVRAFDATTGVELWNLRVGGSPIGVDFAPVVADGVVYVSGENGRVVDALAPSAGSGIFALDAASGAPRWTATVDGAGGSPIRVAGNDVFVDASQLVALDRTTGAVRWSAPVGNRGSSGYSQPAVTGHLVVVGGGDGSVYAFDRATGAQRWTRHVSETVQLGAGPNVSATERFVYVTAPAHELGLIGDQTGPGQLRALDPVSGEVRWARPISGMSSVGTAPTVSGGIVYVPGAELAAFDAETGARRWTARVAGSRTLAFTPLTVAETIVYLPGADGLLHAFGARSGSRRGTAGARPPGARDADAKVAPLPPAVADGVLYLGSGDLRLYAYQAPARL